MPGRRLQRLRRTRLSTTKNLCINHSLSSLLTWRLRYQRIDTRASNSGKQIMAPAPSISEVSHLLNPLATSLQLETSASQLDGVPGDLEDSIRFETSRLVQAAGILLRLPQEIIAQCLIILQRFWTGPDGGSLLENDSKVCSRVP